MIVPNLRDSLRDGGEASPWLEMMLEFRNAKIHGSSLEALIKWVEQVETGGSPANFRVVLRRPGVAIEVEGNVANPPNPVEEQEKLGVHLVREAELVGGEEVK